ncbi:hypothetical protein E2C01_038228 [Portunus trituberculatus]|uniref:Uncharacterized protein n=1 Tax=Portunus trituberculatus TaxID=210409 RepID=A0A5B7FHG3_PORTR|nr:hypothetical protein [Portunus trituberculatus]
MITRFLFRVPAHLLSPRPSQTPLGRHSSQHTPSHPTLHIGRLFVSSPPIVIHHITVDHTSPKPINGSHTAHHLPSLGPLQHPSPAHYHPSLHPLPSITLIIASTTAHHHLALLITAHHTTRCSGHTQHRGRLDVST